MAKVNRRFPANAEGDAEEAFFLKRLMRWVIMSEQWPVRMTLILHQLSDDAQLNGGALELASGKEIGNARFLTAELLTPTGEEHPLPPEVGHRYIDLLKKSRPTEKSASQIVDNFMKEEDVTEEESAKVAPAKCTEVAPAKCTEEALATPALNMPLHQFYRKEVEHLIFGPVGAFLEKIIALDGDPEVFDAILYYGTTEVCNECKRRIKPTEKRLTVPDKSKGSCKVRAFRHVPQKCPANDDDDAEDVAWLQELTVMDVYFLERFSFNLNPAISQTIKTEFGRRRIQDENGYYHKPTREEGIKARQIQNTETLTTMRNAEGWQLDQRVAE